jgi:hypothetical protein
MRLSSQSHRHWCTSCTRHHEYACRAADCDKPTVTPCPRAETLAARKKLVAKVALTSLMAMVAAGCGRTHKPVHVPRVRYHATFNDKDCKPSSDGGFDCNHVHFNPLEIDAKGQR